MEDYSLPQGDALGCDILPFQGGRCGRDGWGTGGEHAHASVGQAAVVGCVGGSLVGWGKTPSNPDVKPSMFFPDVYSRSASG